MTVQPRRLSIAVFASLLAFASCSHQKPQTTASTQPELPSEGHAAPSAAPANQTVLQKTFTVTTSISFPFEIPAHSIRPHLHGVFESFVRDLHGQSDEAANLDFLLLNQDQFDDFSQGHPSEALFSAEPSHNQAINFDLPASFDHSARYYLIFRSSTGATKKVVEANFRVDF